MGRERESRNRGRQPARRMSDLKPRMGRFIHHDETEIVTTPMPSQQTVSVTAVTTPVVPSDPIQALAAPALQSIAAAAKQATTASANAVLANEACKRAKRAVTNSTDSTYKFVAHTQHSLTQAHIASSSATMKANKDFANKNQEVSSSAKMLDRARKIATQATKTLHQRTVKMASHATVLKGQKVKSSRLLKSTNDLLTTAKKNGKHIPKSMSACLSRQASDSLKASHACGKGKGLNGKKCGGKVCSKKERAQVLKKIKQKSKKEKKKLK